MTVTLSICLLQQTQLTLNCHCSLKQEIPVLQALGKVAERFLSSWSRKHGQQADHTSHNMQALVCASLGGSEGVLAAGTGLQAELRKHAQQASPPALRSMIPWDYRPLPLV